MDEEYWGLVAWRRKVNKEEADMIRKKNED